MANNTISDTSITDTGNTSFTAPTDGHNDSQDQQNKKNNATQSAYDEAKAAGLDDDLAAVWSNYDWNNPVGHGLFGVRRNRKHEEIELAKSTAWNDLLHEQATRTYNSEQEKYKRLRAAGVNPDITGGESLGNASEMTENENPADITGMESANAAPGQIFDQVSRTIAQVGTVALGCVQLGNALSVMDSDVIGAITKLHTWQDDNGYDLLGFKTDGNGKKIIKPFKDLSPQDLKEFADAVQLDSSSVSEDAYTSHHRKYIEKRVNDLFRLPRYRRAAMNYYDSILRETSPAKHANDVRRSSGVLQSEADAVHNAAILQQFGINPQSNLPGMSGVLDVAGASDLFKTAGEAKKYEIQYNMRLLQLSNDEAAELLTVEEGEDSYAKTEAIRKKYESRRNVETSKFHLDQSKSFVKMLTDLEKDIAELRKAGKTKTDEYKLKQYAYIAALSGEFGDFTHGGNLYNTIYPDAVGMSPNFRNFGHAADVVSRLLGLGGQAQSLGQP